MKKIKFTSPNIIFIGLLIITVILSYIFRNEKFILNSNEEVEKVFNLLSVDGINWILENVVNNFKNFPVLPMVLIVAIGVGVAEESGFLEQSIRLGIMNIPKKFLTPLLLFFGIIGNIAGSASFAIIPPLGGIIFKHAKRNPLIGIITGFAGVAGGLSANIFIAPTDVLSAGITETASKIIDPSYTVLPTANWYFFAISTIFLIIFGTIAIEYFISPMVLKYDLDIKSDIDSLDIINIERSVIKYSFISILIYIIVVYILKINILKSIIFLITLLFLIPSLVYSIITNKVKSSKDVFNMMNKSISKLSSFIVLCFFASQFIGVFKKTNIGLFIAIKFTGFLKNVNINIYLFIILFIIFATIINLFIGSLSAKWIILAPVFVPLFMKLGYSPEFSQVVFRISDSITNPISPLEPFIAFILVCMNKYSSKIGLKDLIKFMFPISISFFIAWIIQLFIWLIFNFSLGPGAFIHLI